MVDYWNRIGDNKSTLQGVPGDPSNPALLDDDFIIFALQHSTEARTALEAVLPHLLPAEQARLQAILDYPDSRLIVEDQTIADSVQRKQNTAGIYTTGPRGGGN